MCLGCLDVELPPTWRFKPSNGTPEFGSPPSKVGDSRLVVGDMDTGTENVLDAGRLIGNWQLVIGYCIDVVDVGCIGR